MEAPRAPEPPPPPKAVTHVLEWNPQGWASLELNRGDGLWVHVASNSLRAINRIYAKKMLELKDGIDRAEAEQARSESGGVEWQRLQRALESFSRVEYRVREWPPSHEQWMRHSVGMEATLRRIRGRLMSEVSADRLRIRALDEAERAQLS